MLTICSRVPSVRCDGVAVSTKSDDVDCAVLSGLGIFGGGGAIGWTTAVTTLPDDAELTVTQPSSLAALHSPGLHGTLHVQLTDTQTVTTTTILMDVFQVHLG